MKIAIFPQSLLPIHANSLEERPLGGTETGIIRLSKSLQERGHQVVVFTHHKDPPKSDPPFYHLSLVNKMRPVDLFISVREWIPLVSQIPAKLKVLWTGDSYDQPHNFGIGDKRVAQIIDGIFSVSSWHADTLSKASGFPRNKIFPILNGVHLPYFEGAENRIEKSLIYSSTPYRGLELLPAIFSELKKKHPSASLQIFSGFKVYEGNTPYNQHVQEQYKSLFEKLRNMEGVNVHGNVLQKDLARHFMRSSVLAYPNIFAETSCITAMEAQIAGCVPVTSAIGALPETVGDRGVLLAGDPRSAKYQQQFIAEIDSLWSSPKRLHALSKKGSDFARANFSWTHVATRLEGFYQSMMQQKSPPTAS